MYIILAGDTVLAVTVAIFLIAIVMNLALSAIITSSGLIFLIINLQQALESSKSIKLNR